MDPSLLSSSKTLLFLTIPRIEAQADVFDEDYESSTISQFVKDKEQGVSELTGMVSRPNTDSYNSLPTP
jgi:hypothetical protein